MKGARLSEMFAPSDEEKNRGRRAGGGGYEGAGGGRSERVERAKRSG